MDTKANKVVRLIEQRISILEGQRRGVCCPKDRIDGEIYAYRMCLSEIKAVFGMCGR